MKLMRNIVPLPFAGGVRGGEWPASILELPTPSPSRKQEGGL
jgi:hypothetical protein